MPILCTINMFMRAYILVFRCQACKGVSESHTSRGRGIGHRALADQFCMRAPKVPKYTKVYKVQTVQTKTYRYNRQLIILQLTENDSRLTYEFIQALVLVFIVLD